MQPQGVTATLFVYLIIIVIWDVSKNVDAV
jgi:hypothetical protein